MAQDSRQVARQGSLAARQPDAKRAPMPPVLRGFLWAGLLFVLGLAVMFWVDRWPGSNPPLVTEPSVTVAWLLALVGWLLGIGGWEAVAKPWLGLPYEYTEARGWRRYFALSLDNKVVGIQYLVGSIGTFGAAGLMAMGIRAQLMNYKGNFFPTDTAYLTAVTAHGVLMLLGVAVVGFVGGFGNYFVPLMIGSRSRVFPRMGGMAFWLYPAGVITILLMPLLGGSTAGLWGYAPLSAQDPSGQIFYYLGILAMGVSSLLTSFNLLVTIIFYRAPGLTWGRMPVFIWAQIAGAIMSLIWLPEIATTMMLGLLDRIIPTDFFNPHGGFALAWESLFWLFGHPEVYIVMLPAWAIWLEVTSVMSQKTLFAKGAVVTALGALAVLSSIVWAHHMFTSIRNASMIPFSFFTESVSIPTGVMFLSALGTMWRGRMRLNTPMLYVLFSMFNFTIGGLTGFFLADVPANLTLHNTFFVVAHFHFTLLGGMIFAWLGAMYYWLPKYSGRMYNEKWGIIGAFATWVFFNATFLQMFAVGLHGMNRWVGQYPKYLMDQNIGVSIAAFLLGISFVVALWNVAYSWVKGEKAPENPWQAKTLEWQTSSPPPANNFIDIPQVKDGFYGYGDAGPEIPLFVSDTERALERRRRRSQ